MSTSRCDRCIVAGVPCHDCRLRALERAGKGIEPTGRLRVVESENARLRYAIRVILFLRGFRRSVRRLCGYLSRATGVLARTGVGRTTRKADTGAVFHPASRPTFTAAERAWLAAEDERRHKPSGWMIP